MDCDVRMKDHLVAITSEMYHVDTLICGGDFGFFKSDEQAREVFDCMPAHSQKILILGNHDEKNRYIKRLPWDLIVRSIGFRYQGLSFAFQHRPFHKAVKRTTIPRWLLQKSAELFLNKAEKQARKELGSFFLDTQNDIPMTCDVALFGHIHELGQRFQWHWQDKEKTSGTLLVNCCAEHWDFRTFDLDEIVREHSARLEYEKAFQGRKRKRKK